MDELKKVNLFKEKILPILNYVGSIGAAIMCVAYIILVIVLIQGFKVDSILNTTIFSCVSAGVGFIILQFLKYQGISFAELENKEILELYHGTKTKDKKSHSLRFYWVTSVIKDILVKCVTLAGTSIGIVFIIIKGSEDYNLILLALVNLLMFISFGFISLEKAYNYFNRVYIKYIKEQLEEAKEEQQNA